MRLEDALNASSIGAAALPAVADIVHCREGRTYWWLNTRYVDRGVQLHEGLLQSDNWHPFERADLLPGRDDAHS